MDTGGRLFAVAMDALRSNDDPGQRITWARAAITSAVREADVATLVELVDGDRAIDGFRLDQDMRWSILVMAASHDLAGTEHRLEAEAARDPSDRGERAALRAGAAWPDRATKARTWDSVHDDGYGSDYRTRAAMAGFQWRHQRELLEPFRAAFFERVRDVYRSHDLAFARSYVRLLVPDRWGEPDVAAQVRDLVTRLDDSEGAAQPAAPRGRRRPRAGDPGARARISRRVATGGLTSGSGGTRGPMNDGPAGRPRGPSGRGRPAGAPGGAPAVMASAVRGRSGSGSGRPRSRAPGGRAGPA